MYEIKNLLPHRYPFLLIDKIISLTPEKVLALKNVSANEPFFVGHFPNFPVMPGVLQLESMAQAAGLLLTLSESFDCKKDIAFLASIDKAKFRRMVVPGDQLVLEVSLIAFKKNILKVEGLAKVNKELASQAEITLVKRLNNLGANNE